MLPGGDGPVVRVQWVGLRGAAAFVQQRPALLRHAQRELAVVGEDVPVAERLGEQRVDLVGGGGRVVVGGECLRLVVGRDLEAATRLEVDVPQLDPAPPRPVGTASPACGNRADEPSVVEEELAYAVELLRGC